VNWADPRHRLVHRRHDGRPSGCRSSGCSGRAAHRRQRDGIPFPFALGSGHFRGRLVDRLGWLGDLRGRLGDRLRGDDFPSGEQASRSASLSAARPSVARPQRGGLRLHLRFHRGLLLNHFVPSFIAPQSPDAALRESWRVPAWTGLQRAMGNSFTATPSSADDGGVGTAALRASVPNDTHPGVRPGVGRGARPVYPTGRERAVDVRGWSEPADCGWGGLRAGSLPPRSGGRSWWMPTPVLRRANPASSARDVLRAGRSFVDGTAAPV